MRGLAVSLSSRRPASGGATRTFRSLRGVVAGFAAMFVLPTCAPTPVERYVDVGSRGGSDDRGAGVDPTTIPPAGAGGESSGGGATNGGAGAGDDADASSLVDAGGGGRAGNGGRAASGAGGTGGSKATIALPDASVATPFDAGICGFERHTLERVAPEVMLVLDRSESMLTANGGATTTRWTEFTAGLVDILGASNGTVRWGLKTYPTSAQCAVGPAPEVEIGTASAPVVTAIQAGAPMKGFGTPTGAAIKAATAYLLTRTTTNPKYIVLATDDEPTCTKAAGQMRSLDAVGAAKAAGISTFVVGTMAEPAADAALNAIAEAGGVPRTGALKYYPIANRKELVDVFTDITNQVTTCTFPVSKPPPAPNNVEITVGNVRIPRDETRANGWDYDATSKAVRLYGPACAGLKDNRAASVEMVFGCAPVVVK